MIREKIKQKWDGLPPWLKRVIEFLIVTLGFFLEAVASNTSSDSDDESETEQLDQYREKLYFDSDGSVTPEVTSERYLPWGK